MLYRFPEAAAVLSVVKGRESDLEVKCDNDDVHSSHFSGKKKKKKIEKQSNLNQGRQSVIKVWAEEARLRADIIMLLWICFDINFN